MFLLAQKYPNPHVEPSDNIWFGLFFFLSPVILFGAATIRANMIGQQWERGLFNGRLGFSRDNLLEAYICLAARMILSDMKSAGEKVIYMNRYFQQHFPDSNYNFSETLTNAYKNPVQLGVITSWLKINLPQRKQRLQVMYFLAGLSMIDGSLEYSELALLEQVSDLLELTPKEFKSIIGMYTGYQRQSRKAALESNKESYIQICSEILGVSEQASIEEIKKAYRRLVKVHHPDLFYNASPGQQQIAEDRFIKIQKAYEVLEKLK